MLGIWRSARLENYACPDCGYLESYLRDLPEKGELIQKKWLRVKA